MGPQPRSIEEVGKAIDNSPLFMKQLPAAGEMDEYLATQMDALQSLLYEGDAEGEWKSRRCHHRSRQKLLMALPIYHRASTELQRARQ